MLKNCKTKSVCMVIKHENWGRKYNNHKNTPDQMTLAHYGRPGFWKGSYICSQSASLLSRRNYYCRKYAKWGNTVSWKGLICCEDCTSTQVKAKCGEIVVSLLQGINKRWWFQLRDLPLPYLCSTGLGWWSAHMCQWWKNRYIFSLPIWVRQQWSTEHMWFLKIWWVNI